jgi:23S rRNA (uracil1939-C5)-methyltransferase
MTSSFSLPQPPEGQERAAECRHFGACGGCLLQHWHTDAYTAYKLNRVVSALESAGLAEAVTRLETLRPAHGVGRRRVLLHARRSSTDGRWRVGFNRARSHDVLDIEHCPVLMSALTPALSIARQITTLLAQFGKPIDMQFTATLEGLDVDVRGACAEATSAEPALIILARDLGLARLSLHGRTLVQVRAPLVAMGDVMVTLPAGGFLQATELGEQIIAGLVLEMVGDKARSIADLFAGTGPFALRLLSKARVFAADGDAPAIGALQHAAMGVRTRVDIKAAVRDLMQSPLVSDELKDFDAVVLNPPRAGAQAQCRWLAASSVPRVVMVSCNAETFARDARTLTQGGYHLERIVPVDQFLYSGHVELVASFTRVAEPAAAPTVSGKSTAQGGWGKPATSRLLQPKKPRKRS